MNGEFRNAFCATRPPGHHAGIFGKTFHSDDPHGNKACSNGFCFINNVAVAAAYLKSQYRSKIKKIAIVDFDVHHGNGTQEIVEALSKPKAFTVKTNVSPYATTEVTSYQFKPWLDFDDGQNVLFTSVHLFDNYQNESTNIFYPGTGSCFESTLESDTNIYPGGVLNVPMTPGTASSANWRQEFSDKIFPRLLEFKPDFILISAGFDAHERD
jgi:acetoin utilization deacetylase AcuC-like enzyme